jgi:hypothetical protein
VSFAPGPEFRFQPAYTADTAALESRIGGDGLMRAVLSWKPGVVQAKTEVKRVLRFFSAKDVDWKTVASSAKVVCSREWEDDMKSQILRSTALALAGFVAGYAMADIAVTGIVVEGNDPTAGIYNVRVEILKEDRVVGSTRTAEDGRFSISLRESPPFRAVARYVKLAYRENPTRVPFEVGAATTASHPLAPVRLIPEDASNVYLATVTEHVVASRKNGNALETAGFYPAILSLPANRKAYVLDQVRVKDPELFSALNKADGSQSDAARIENALRKENPSITVVPDYASKEDRFLVDGARNVKLGGKNVPVEYGILKKQDLIRDGVIRP